MKFYIHFKKAEGTSVDDVYMDDSRLIVFKSLFPGNIQYSKEVGRYFLEWLQDEEKTQKDICGNSCCLTEQKDGILIEDIYWDIACEIIVKKEQLIYAIEQWIEFISDFKERVIEFADVQFQ